MVQTQASETESRREMPIALANTAIVVALQICETKKSVLADDKTLKTTQILRTTTADRQVDRTGYFTQSSST